MNQLTVNQYISRLFEPTLVLSAVALLGAIRSGLQGTPLQNFLLVLLVGMTIPVVFFRYWFVKSKRVSDWDVHDRKQRIKPLAFLVAITIIDFFIIRQFSNQFLDSLFLLFLIWILGFFLITLKFKISGHVGITTLAVGLIIRWYTLAYWPLFFAIPLVAWARVTGKNHTLGEVLLGAGYSLVVLFATGIILD